MIKTVIFDLGRVLVPFNFHHAYQTISERSGLDVAEIPRRFAETDLFVQYESGKIETPEFVEQVTGLLGFEASIDEFGEIWSSIFERRTLIPESVPETLRTNGYKVLLLSNTNDLHFRFLRKNYPILDHFDHHVLSYQVGAMKPSRQIYEEVIRLADCAPEECFFTDDIEQYVEGAKEAGMDAVQFKRYEQLREELQTRGVQI